MTTSSEGAWLYVRGTQSVRIVRREHPHGRADLMLCGPGTEETCYVFVSVPECMQRQAEIESGFMAEGFTLHRTSDRRRTPDRRQATRNERRRLRC